MVPVPPLLSRAAAKPCQRALPPHNCKTCGFENHSVEGLTSVTSASRVAESLCQRSGVLDCDRAPRGLPCRQQAVLEDLHHLQGLKCETAAGTSHRALFAVQFCAAHAARFWSSALPCCFCATTQNSRACCREAPTTSSILDRRHTQLTWPSTETSIHLQGRQPAMLSALDTWLGCFYRRFG